MVTATVTDTIIKETVFDLIGQIAPEANVTDLSPTEDIREAFDIDSFDFLNLLIGLNETFGVEIPEVDYGKLISLTDIVDYLLARIA